MRSNNQFFNSHKDFLFKLMLCGFFVIFLCVFIFVFILYIFDLINFSFYAMLILLLILGISYIPCFVFNNFRYSITNQSIIILVLNWKLMEIPFNQILVIQKKSTSSYQYGVGLKRISIVLKNKREINITPECIKSFLIFLNKKRPEIDIVGWVLD